MNGDNSPESSRPRWMIGAMLFLAAPLAVIWWPGCRQYPPVSSPEALQLIKLVYAACNTRDSIRLERAEREIEKLQRDGKLSPRERDAFTGIVRRARAGQWKKAEEAAFKFAQDQVGAGHPAKQSPKASR